jgi:hypothetical protein
MSNITVYNRMSIDPRDINVEDKVSQNHQVAPGGNTPGLSFAVGEYVIITIISPGDQLTNGCWIVFPDCCDYEFILGEPPGLSEHTTYNKKVLSTPPHKPTWELKITNRSCPQGDSHRDTWQEPNITVGDNQRKLNLFELGMTLERYTLGLPSGRCQEVTEQLVIGAIAFMSGYAVGKISPVMELENDLGLTKYQRRALAAPFIDIAKMYNPKARINRSQCGSLKTVQGAIDLVKKEACI